MKMKAKLALLFVKISKWFDDKAFKLSNPGWPEETKEKFERFQYLETLLANYTTKANIKKEIEDLKKWFLNNNVFK